ncbi:ribonuclease P protein component [Candidatus Peregrinibacteria bacterium]|nr:MAG: ribonuclease P protein component [Candidatus Peregrinibacteria bacterium]
MLSRQHRLTRGFEVLFRKGEKRIFSHFIFRSLPAFDGVSRLSVIVSKKTEKMAVGRNRIRRRLFEVARKSNFPEFLPLPFRIVLVARSSAKNASFSELEKDFLEACTATSISQLKNKKP